MKERNHSNVTFANTDVHKRVTLIDMFYPFMKEQSHSIVIFVTIAVLKTVA